MSRRRAAETVFEGMVETLQRSKATGPAGLPDVHLSSFISAATSNLTLLSPLMSDGSADEDKVLLLRVLRHLLCLDANLALAQHSAGTRFIVDAYTWLLGLRRADLAGLRRDAMKLLPAALHVKDRGSMARITQAVQLMVDNCLPTDTYGMIR